MNEVERFRSALDEERYSECIEFLRNTYERHGSNFKKAVLNEELFITPISYKYTDEFHSKFERLFELAINDAEDKGMEEYKVILLKIGTVYEIVHENFSHIMKIIGQNDLFKNTYQNQIRMICIFIQDQLRLHKEEIKKEKNPINIGTGEYIASQTSELNPKMKLSSNSIIEALIEILNAALPYILYVKNNAIDDAISDNKLLDLCYTRVPKFEIMIRALNQSILYKWYWEKFKYEECELKIVNAYDTNKDVFSLIPLNDKKEKIHFIGQTRRSLYSVNITKGYLCEHKKEFLLGQKSIEKIALNVKVNNIETLYKIEKTDYKEATLVYKWMYLAYGKLIHSFYWEQRIKGISVRDIIKGHEFLTVISQIYDIAVDNVFNKDDRNTYQYLAPIMCIDDIINLFSRLYDISDEVAKKIIDCYVYNNQLGRQRDIFSYPLIYAGNDNIVLSSYLISQLNIPRFVENICLDNKVKITPIGIRFENSLREQLNTVDNINVNTNKLQFVSSQGDVEYDFLAMFDEYLVIMEFKAVITPYNEKRLKNDEKIIKEGVKQVKRRCEIIKTDWDKIKQMVNIELPDKPVSEEKIIKIVCTNIYDFSTLEYDGVIITDESLLYKYFKDPYIREKVNGKPYVEEKLWKKGRPLPDEFISYLKNPKTITMIDRCVKLQGKTFPVIVGEKIMGVTEFYLNKNPYAEWKKNLPYD